MKRVGFSLWAREYMKTCLFRQILSLRTSQDYRTHFYITRTTSLREALLWLYRECMSSCSVYPIVDEFSIVFLLLFFQLSKHEPAFSIYNFFFYYLFVVKNVINPTLIYLITASPPPIDAASPCLVNTCMKTNECFPLCQMCALMWDRLWTELVGVGPVAGKLRPPEWWPQSEERLGLAPGGVLNGESQGFGGLFGVI